MTTIESGSNSCSCCRDGTHHSHQHDSTADQSQLPKHDIKSEMLGTVRGLAQRSLQPFWNSVSASQFHIVLMDLIPVRLSKLGLQTGNYPLDIRIVSVIATLTMSALNALSAVMWYVWDWLTTPKKQPLFEVSSNASDDGSAQPKDIQPTFMAKVKMAAAATVGWKVAVDSKDSKKKKNKQKKSKKMDIVDEKTIKSEQQPLLTPEQQQQQQQQNKQHKQTQTQQNLMHKIGVAVQHMSTGNIDNNLATSQVHESLTWLITNSVMKLNYGKFTLISENEYYDMNQGRAPRFDLIPDVGSAPIELQPIDDPREFLLDNLRSKAAAALENEDVDATALTEQFVTSTKESAQVATNRRDIIAKEATTNAKKPFIVHFREGTDIKVNYDDDGGGCMCSECRGDNDEEEDTSRNIASRPTYLVETSRGDDRTVGDVQQFLHNVVQANKYSNRYDMRRRVYYFKQYTWTDTDGNWQTIRYLDDTNGGLDSVALDREQEHVLKEDLENFENDRDFYLRNGLPYRRAYLLHGRPGCGKTSLANALANHLKRLVFVLNLRQINSSVLFKRAMERIAWDCGIQKRKPIIVFEDVDTHVDAICVGNETEDIFEMFLADLMLMHEQNDDNDNDDNDNDDGDDDDDYKRREDGSLPWGSWDEEMYAEEENDEEDGTGAVLMSEMLNAEEGDGDGMSPGGGSGGGINGIGPVRPKELQPITFADFVATIEGMGVPSGSIFILTTNHPEKLNPALFQDGRIDLSLGLGYCTHYQISHMYGFVIGATHIVNEEITERESALKRDLKLAKKQVHSKFKRVLNNPNISAREKIRREMQRDQMVQIRLDLIRKRYNDDVLRGRKSIKLHQMPKEMYNEMVDTIPEYVIAPCKAMQVMLANRHTPDRIIPELAKLVPRQKTK